MAGIKKKEESILRYELKNRNPVELSDLTNSLSAFANEYTSFAATDAGSVTTDGVRLYVKEITSGSIIAHLMASAPAAVFPFIDNANSIFAFAGHLHSLFSDLKTGKVEKGKYNRQSLENAAQILEPVAKDNGSQFNIVGNNNQVYIDLKSTEANAIQNQSARVVKDLQLPQTGRHRAVVIKWFQARNDPESKTGDRAIIESIYDKSVKTIFMSSEDKADILSSDNLFTGAYIADVDVETVNGKPALYKIVRMHERLDIE